jgi:23S rRNA (uridine2552-2'-O)-methyltransferase
VVVVRADVLAVREPESASSNTPSGEPTDPVLVHAPYDVVMSDMAPSTSGSKVSDQARSFELFMKALDVAMHVGKSGSSFVGKIFMSGDFPKAKEAVAAHFETCRALKPAGTRSESSEIYLVGFQLHR